ncbi:MAG: hypothetical protein EU547_05850 [Promethearchaeota archaeon]|nr:MAG: hypothetical protein EU547_05850 [Candidatus Lokiarchaeota archaeon]
MKNKFVIQKSKKFFSLPLEQEVKTISNEDLKNLPSLIQNYIKKINLLGKKQIKRVKLRQKGDFKLKPDSKWKHFTAEQYINTEKLSFLWYGKIQMVPLVNVHVIDEYISGKGALSAKLMNLIKVVDEDGSKFDQGEFLRFLGETPWYPSLYIDKRLKWSKKGDSKLEIKLSDNGNDISGKILFNEMGLIEEFTAKRYYNNQGQLSLEDWHGYCYDYKKINDIMVPSRFKACWHFEDFEYCYIRGNITDIEFNNTEIY